MQTQTHDSPPLFCSSDDEELELLLLLLLELELFDDEEELFEDELLLFELDELDDLLLASLVTSSFFFLQDASYCFPFFLKDEILRVIPLSSHPMAVAMSTWHLPLSLDFEGF